MFRWLVRLVASIRRLLGLAPGPTPMGSGASGSGNPPSSAGSAPGEEILTNAIRVLGTQGSGKTTFLAALLRNPSNEHESSPIRRIAPIGSGAERLLDQAFNILQDRDYLQPNRLNPQATTIEDIGFRLEIFLPRSRSQETVTLSLFAKDYSGEFFRDLRLHTTDILDNYLTDCAESQGLMLLVDGTNVEEDGELEMNLPFFLRRLDQAAGGDGWRGRIAFVVSKCEQTRLYLKRTSLGDVELVRRLFPKAVRILESNCPRNVTIDYFTLSSFGVLGGLDPEPNVRMVTNDQGEYRATIRNPRVWKPFGLASPLYWLCKGERHPDL